VNKSKAPEWRAIGHAERGASHIRANQLCQDTIRWAPDYPEPASGPPLVLAVSDGHGSPRSFRSRDGSQFAVEAALETLQHLLNNPDHSNTAKMGRIAKEFLPKAVVSTWCEKVEKHRSEHPFTDDEMRTLYEKQGDRALRSIKDNPLLAYGATLLAVLVTEQYILYLQLGDGDILVVSSDGLAARPLPRDERLIGNETTSLCMHNAWQEIRVHIMPIFEASELETMPFETSSAEVLPTRPVSAETDRWKAIPAMILVSSDGYANSYSSEDDFVKIGADYLNMLRAQDITVIMEMLGDILRDTSQHGSGDDITLGIIKRLEDKLESESNGQQYPVVEESSDARADAADDQADALNSDALAEGLGEKSPAEDGRVQADAADDQAGALNGNALAEGAGEQSDAEGGHAQADAADGQADAIKQILTSSQE
jgi:serine/threonine protein phosphatase PrpC